MDDGGMPWVVHEVVPLPDPVAQAQQVLGDRLNILIGHFLAGHPNSRIGAILERSAANGPRSVRICRSSKQPPL